MQKYLSIALVLVVTVTTIIGTSCGRGVIRSRTHKAGDRSVTIVHRPRAKAIKGRSKPVTSTKYNRAVK